MTKIHCINYQEINSKNICIHIHSQYQISNKYTKTSSSTEVYGKNFKILTADRDNDIKKEWCSKWLQISQNKRWSPEDSRMIYLICYVGNFSDLTHSLHALSINILAGTFVNSSYPIKTLSDKKKIKRIWW